MCSVICSATSAWSLTYLTELSSLKCKDNYFQQSLKGAGPLENMGVGDLLDFQTVRKSENLRKEGFVRFYKKYVFYRSVFVLEEKKPTTQQEIAWGEHVVQRSFWGFEELCGYPERERKAGPTILKSLGRLRVRAWAQSYTQPHNKKRWILTNER